MIKGQYVRVFFCYRARFCHEKEYLKPLKTHGASQMLEWDLALGVDSKPFPFLTSLLELAANHLSCQVIMAGSKQHFEFT